jgi:hypothetical protein
LSSYINTATQCDANTLFKGDDGATEWAGSNSAPSTTGSATSGLTQWHNPATTNYFKVAVSTLHEITTSSVPTTTPTYSSLYTGTGSISIYTSESSAPYHNLTSESSTTSSTISKGTAVSTLTTAPVTTGTSTPTPSDPCAGTEGSRYVDANGVAYEVISGADSSINSYSNTEESSIKDCFALCDEQAQCQGYTYVTSGIPSGICYLKNEIGEFIQNNNTVNMCSAFRCATPANGTTTFTPSGSVVPPPNTSSAPYKNSTLTDTSTITSSATSSVFQNSSIIDPSSITSSVTSSAPYKNITIIDPSTITSSATSSAPYKNSTTGVDSFYVETSASTSQPERTIVTTQTVTTTDVETETLTLGNSTTTLYSTSTYTTGILQTITVTDPASVSVSTETLTLTQKNGTTTFEIPHTVTTIVTDPVVTSVSTETQTLTEKYSNEKYGNTTAVEIPHTVILSGSVSTETQTLTEKYGNGTTTIETPHTITATFTDPIVTSISVSTETKTLTEKYGNNTTIATVEIPHTITVTGPTVTQSAFISTKYEHVPITETITRENGTTTTIVRTSSIPYTTTVDKSNTIHEWVPYTVLTSYETKCSTETKTNANATTPITKTFTLPHVKTVTPPVSILTKTVYASSVVTRPCTTIPCPKSATTSVSRYNTTIVESITASCSTLPQVIGTKTSTIETTLANSNKTITFESCDTYTEPATSMWVYVYCNTTTSSLESATSTITLSSPKSANATTTTISLSFANTTSIATSGTGVPGVPCNTTTSSINSANLTSTQSFTTSTIFTTSVRTVSSLNSTSLSTTSIPVSTTVVPVGPTTAPVSTAVGSSAVGSSAVGSSAVGSSAVGSSAVGSSAGSSPVSPVTAHTTQMTRIASTSQFTVPVTVTATHPGVSSPVSSHVSPEQPLKPVSPELPSKPVSPAQPSVPVSPEQPSKPVSPAQTSKPVSPEQPSSTSARKTYTGTLITPTATPSGPATSKLNANTTLSEKTKANHIPPTASATAVAGASAKNSNNVVAGLAVVAAAMMVL